MSIVRTGQDAATLRRRMEGPARLGRYILGLLGLVTSSAGLAFWITTTSVVGLALGAFGGALIILGVVQHALYRRDRAHWAEQALLFEDGVELVLHNGEVRAATWSDADLMLQLVDRRAPSPGIREYLLVWMIDPKIPPVELSPEGYDRVRRTAEERHLHVSQRLRGSRKDATRLVEIRPSSGYRIPDFGRPAGESPDSP